MLSNKRLSKIKKYLTTARFAFPKTVPVFAGYVFAGISFGLLMNNAGFPSWLTIIMCITIISGSAQFLAVDLLQTAFDPVTTIFVNLMVNSRYTFCGLTLLDRYKGTGLLKPYLIWTITDETFVINLTTDPKDGVVLKDFMVVVAALDHFYWILGGTLGALIGELITFNMQGIEFAMTGMFSCIFLDQWTANKNHKPAITGVLLALICLLIFNARSFMLPTMILILITLTIYNKIEERRVV